MGFKKINNITGWIVFAIASLVYLLTMEPTVSLWDCGEFITTAYRLEVGHSPGAPLFMIMGRIFTLFVSDPANVAMAVNAMSAILSGFTILFLFWSITHFARKITFGDDYENATSANLIGVMGAGIVGALAYTFSDTFWFSAVEGEVYATSSFFTALVFWAALKWEDSSESPHADRWMILIFYLMGLSVGVHLLNLLTIPAIVMIYYFKRYKPTLTGGVIAFFVGCVVLAFLQFGVIQLIPIIASWFEIKFVNSIGLPFYSGAFFFMLLLVGIIVFLLMYASKKGKRLLQLSVLCATFAIIGYSSYVATIVRSRADVPIDMGNPDNIVSLIPYLQRDQYGSQPIVSGPYFTSRPIKEVESRGIYAAVQKDGKDFYQKIGSKPNYQYDKVYFFPRIWSFTEERHINFYRAYLGLSNLEEPTSADNYKFFFKYQLNWMYWRYFMWNYVGRQNDIEGQGEAKHGNWISGVKPIDKMFGKGDIDLMPDSAKNNKARNEYYFLPFILGIIGLIYHYKKHKYDWIVVMLFFFFTGIAIQLYINNTPVQPRERDYAYISTYAFAMWIGLGVLMVSQWLSKFLKGSTAPAAATALCLLAVPILMGAKNWDDHDRSKKTIALDHAYNMLNNCDSNAILITYGDNDTYPLWYLQEVEGYRTDVRIFNYNLLGTDWQNEQMFNKINDADAIPVIWENGQFVGDDLNYIPISTNNPKINANAYYNLEEVIKIFSSGKNKRAFSNGATMSYLPTRNMFVPIDKQAIINSGLANIADTALIPSEIRITLSKDKTSITRGEMSFMNIIAGQAKTGWTRPIYTTDGVPVLGLDGYLRNEGILNKFVPINKTQLENQTNGLAATDLDKNIKLFTETFQYGGANGDNIYYDEKNRLVFLSYRMKSAAMANILSFNDRKADAIKVLDAFFEKVSETSLSYEALLYDRGILLCIDAYYRAGAQDKARKLGDRVIENTKQDMKYYEDLGDVTDALNTNATALQMNTNTINTIISIAMQNGDIETANRWKGQPAQQDIPAQLQPQLPAESVPPAQ